MLAQSTDTLFLFTSLLNLPDCKVINVKNFNSDRKVVIEVKSTREKLPCRECGKPTRGHGVGRIIRLRHLPILGKETYIEIKPKRGICEYCDDKLTTTERLDWYNLKAKLTKPFEQHLLFELVNSTIADVSRKENVDYHTINNLINHYIESDVDFSQIKAIGILGLDEISLKKGYQDFVTLITYRVNNQVLLLGVVKGREKSDIIRFLRTIPRNLRKTIRAICCDLYKGYMNACKEVFKGKIPVVADRFHVRKIYRKSLISLRKSELSRLKKELSDVKYAELKKAIAILRKQKDYFTDDEKHVISKLFSLSPKLKAAYQYSRELTGIFDSHITPDEAKNKIMDWIDEVINSDLTCFNKFIKTLINYQTQITNYFLNRNNSGFVEGFNNKVKVLKRRCYGLSNIIKLFQRLTIDTLGMKRFAPGMVAF